MSSVHPPPGLHVRTATSADRDAVCALLAEATGGQGVPLPRGRAVGRAVALMQANLEVPLSIAELARRAGFAQRRLEQRMKAEMGASPQVVYRRLRLIHARKLVQESDLPVAEVALRCGYLDASAMTRAFRAEFGTTPRELRSGDQAGV